MDCSDWELDVALYQSLSCFIGLPLGWEGILVPQKNKCIVNALRLHCYSSGMTT